MGRVYITNPKDGKKIQIHYRVHKLECGKCKAINKLGNSVQGRVGFCDKHNKCKARSSE